MLHVSAHAHQTCTPLRGFARFYPVNEYVYGKKLKGYIRLFSYVSNLGVLAHEIMHTWANFIIPSGRPHWGFSSANGVLGGFDPARLVRLGNGRYTAGRFLPAGNIAAYSPIELYLAGWIPPEEVPDVWVAKDGVWSNERDSSGNPVFTASDTETWSIQRIVREHGTRVPNWVDSQKSFRVATMLIVDDFSSAYGAARELSVALEAFARHGSDGDDGSYNFWEATGGRATVGTDGLLGNGVPMVRRPFTDQLIVPGVTPVKAVHFAELRERIDALRGATGLGSFPWTDPILGAGMTRIRLTHLLELREALAAAYAAAGRAAPGWTDTAPAAGATAIKAAHVMELRTAVTALE